TPLECPQEGMKFRYIAIEGVIGVGKTTLVEALAERLDATQVLEEWEENPFLKPFYDGKAHSAFQTELFFLLSRYRQQRELVQENSSPTRSSPTTCSRRAGSSP